MKVGFIAPMSIAAVNGGMRNQALNTISHLIDLGIEAVKLSPWQDIRDYDLELVHVFGASVENVGIISQFHEMGIPMVLSPVFYSNRSAAFIKRTLALEQLFKPFSRGIRSDFSIQGDICQKSELIFPNTQDEANIIKEAFSISDERIRMIPNGVESHFKSATPDLFIKTYGIEDFVLFVGQSGAKRKNVINLLEVAGQIDAPIVIIGSFYDDEYGKRCNKIAAKWKHVTLIETLDHHSELLASAYAASKVFVLPSQFETPGIAAMEASLAGSRIVITKCGGTKEYFGEHAIYIDPKSSDSLLQGVQHALAKDPSDELKDHILKNYSWQNIAKITAMHYQSLEA